MAVRAVIAGSVTGVAVLWLQDKTGDMGHCRTNAGVDRGLCRADARAAFVCTWVFGERIR